MRKTKISSFFAFSIILLITLTSCSAPPHIYEIKLFEGIVYKLSNDMIESTFCEIYEEHFIEGQEYTCEGDNGYHSDLTKILLPLGDIDNAVIKFEEVNEYIYFFLIHNNEKVYVGFTSYTDEKYILGIK